MTREAAPRRRRRDVARRTARTVLAATALVTCAACSRREPARPAVQTAGAQPSAQTFRGGPAAHPGDWCAGHGVPESQCTRCNPELIPQFRARHDWCEEHGVPESQCTICHPELAAQGVVPPRPRASGGAPEREPGHGAVDGAARDGGVAAGATVHLASPDVAARVGIETVPVEQRAIADEVVVPLRIEFDPTRLARVSARIDGVVAEVTANVGDRVRPGQSLLLLDSAAAAGTRAQVGAARVRLASAEAALRRIEGLAQDRLVTAVQLEQARGEVAAARAELAAQGAAAGLVGAGGGRAVRVASPRAGMVVARPASVGQHVTATEVLVEVADISTVWGVLDVPDADAGRLRVGQAVTIEMDGDPQPLRATLAWIAPTVDPHTRTVRARVELANPEERLRANAFGRARVAVSAGGAGVAVPRDALQRVDAQDVVFVRRSQTDYEARVVTVALRGAREVQLRDGVAPGDAVVTTGSFQLKTELLRDALGAGCCDTN